MDASRHGNTISEDWALLNNQIFLGVLGSSITPRKEIEQLLMVFGEAGVRFVYFSPRNMRRTKEVASQMGIDVAWNCAISLRPLDDGQEDPHRMVSNYADWDVKAKLPHGIEAVRRHLQDVDNVPLLVSLYTDVTKKNTGEMVSMYAASLLPTVVLSLVCGVSLCFLGRWIYQNTFGFRLSISSLRSLIPFLVRPCVHSVSHFIISYKQ